MGATLNDFMSLAAAPRPVAPATPDATAFRDVRVVAFDLDNTLVDIVRVKTRAAEAAAWALADAGLDVDPADAAAGIMDVAREEGIDRDDVVTRYLARHLGTPDPRLVDVGERAFLRAEDAAAVAYPRVASTLLALARRGYALALITDAPRHRAVQRLTAAGLHHYFPVLVTLEDSPCGKADTTPYAVAARRLRVRPEEILMVGDNPARDVGAARAFGCRAVLAEYGFQEIFASDDPAHRPDLSVRWLDELLPALPGAPVATETTFAPTRAL